MTNQSTRMTTGTPGYGSGERLQEAAGGLLDQAGRTAESQASWTMTKAGDTLDEVARAVRDAGSSLRQDRPEIAGFADTAAERVEEAAQYLRQHDATDLIDEASRFARQQPVVVVGGFLLAGLALGRLLKSGSSPASRPGYGPTGEWRGTGHGSGYGSGYGAEYARSTAYGGSTGLGSTRTGTEYGRHASIAAGAGGAAPPTTTRTTTTRTTTRSTGAGTSGTTSARGRPSTGRTPGSTTKSTGPGTTTGTETDTTTQTRRTAGGLSTSER